VTLRSATPEFIFFAYLFRFLSLYVFFGREVPSQVYLFVGGLFWQLQKFIDSFLSFFPSCFLPLLHCTCSVARFIEALDEINSSHFYFRRVLPTISGESFLLFSGGRCRNRFSRAPKGGTSLKQEDRGKRERALKPVLGESAFNGKWGFRI